MLNGTTIIKSKQFIATDEFLTIEITNDHQCKFKIIRFSQLPLYIYKYYEIGN